MTAGAVALLQYDGYVKKACMLEGCDEDSRSRGYCNRHYQQYLKNTPFTEHTSVAPPVIMCIGPECNEVARARSLCSGHYQQWISKKSFTVLQSKLRTDTRDEDGNKRCSKCVRWLPVSEFFPLNSGATRDGLSTNCNLCDRLYRYHITAVQYLTMWAEQGEVCAICERTTKVVCIDHDHACCPERKRSCGKCVRGLLCADCNGALGLMADDSARLLRAAQYLGR